MDNTIIFLTLLINKLKFIFFLVQRKLKIIKTKLNYYFFSLVYS